MSQEPEVFTQQNKYLPFFTFRGYSQSQPLRYSTTIDPKVLSGEIATLNKAYDAGVNTDEGYRDVYSQNVKAAIGDLGIRNDYLSRYNQEADKVLGRYKDEKGRIAYESPEFLREVRAMNRQFATDPIIEQLAGTHYNYEYWNKASKDPNVIDFNPYYDKNNNAWRTDEKGVFYTDIAPIMDYTKPVKDTWAIVKADVTKADIINKISGISSQKELESNRDKINKLVDETTELFLQTPEGAQMLKEYTMPHKKGGVYYDGVSREEAMVEIKKHVQNAGELFKYVKDATVETTEPSWNDMVNIKTQTAKTVRDDSGNEVKVTTMPAGFTQTYTVSGNKFTDPYQLQQNKNEYAKNIEKIKKDFDKWAYDNGASGLFYINTDANGRHFYTLKDRSNKANQDKYGNQLLDYNYKLQLENNKIVYANKFDETALKSAKLDLLTSEERKRNDQRIAEIKKKVDASRIDELTLNHLATYGQIQSASFLMNNNQKLFNDLQLLKKRGIFDTDKNAEAMLEGINTYLKQSGMDAIPLKTVMFADVTSEDFLKNTLSEYNKTLTEQIKKSDSINPKYIDYLDFYVNKSKDLDIAADVYRFDVDKPSQSSYANNLKKSIESGVLTGTMPIYLRQGEQSVMVDIDTLKKEYADAETGKEENSKISNNFKLDGWAFDNDNGLIVVGSLNIGGKFEKVEIRDVNNLDSFLYNEGYDVPIRLDLLKKMSEGFINTSNQESYVGNEYKDKQGNVVQKAYKVEKLLLPEGAEPEGRLKVNFDGKINYFDNYADVIDAYFNHVAENQRIQGDPIVVDGMTLVPTGPGTTAISYNNYLGIQKQVNGVNYWVTYPTPQAGLEASKADLRAKLDGSSGEMTRRYGADYLEKATLQDLLSVWAPASDKRNDPVAYAISVANDLGLSKDTKLANVKDVDALFKAMLKIENNEAYNKLYGGR